MQLPMTVALYERCIPDDFHWPTSLCRTPCSNSDYTLRTTVADEAAIFLARRAKRTAEGKRKDKVSRGEKLCERFRKVEPKGLATCHRFLYVLNRRHTNAKDKRNARDDKFYK